MQKLTFIFLITFLSLPVQANSQSDFKQFFDRQTEYKDISVKEVINIETILLDNDKKIQLIGLKGPEIRRTHERKERDDYGFVVKETVSPIVSLEDQAYKFVQDLLEGEEIRLEFDVDRKGDENKTYAYVFRVKDNLFINAEILKYGFAQLSIRPPNLKYEDQLRAAYLEAKTEQRGFQGQ